MSALALAFWNLKRSKVEGGANVPKTTPIQPNQLGIKVLFIPDNTDAVVHVVAVHGIGADPDWTWTTSAVNWLEHAEMLPRAIPQARVMRFGYDSRWFGDNPVRQRLSNVAARLLQALEAERKDCKERLLVFVAHCFGGLVIQRVRALLIAKVNDHKWKDILNAANGVLFIGTPHRGTGSVTSKGLLYALIASSPSIQVDDTVLRALESGNDVLMDVLNDFITLCNTPTVNISLYCFFEQRSTKVGMIIGDPNLKEFVVDEISGCIDGYPKFGLPLDHFRLNKFSDPNDGNYKIVRDEIQKMVEQASKREAKFSPGEIL